VWGSAAASEQESDEALLSGLGAKGWGSVRMSALVVALVEVQEGEVDASASASADVESVAW
jgi:hypothetical protein